MFRPATSTLPARRLKEHFFSLIGGIDLVTDPTLLGTAPRRRLPFKVALNYEPDLNGNPRRVDGYERFDGRARPHLQNYTFMNFDAGDTAISDGDLLTGGTSGAVGVALIDAVVESGTWAGNDAAGYVAVWMKGGTFQDDEDIEVSLTKVAVVNGAPVEGGAPTDADDLTWRFLAIEEARSEIQKVPGSGPVRGVQWFNEVCYAFRDNAGATAQVLHKSSATGWQAVDLGETIDFTAGTAEVTEGETLTGGTSGATATVERVVKQSGSWGSDAAGFIVLSGRSGDFQSEAGTTTGGAVTLSGASTAITLAPGGNWEISLGNFYGEASYERMYGVDGVNEGFEFDGTVFAPLRIPSFTQKPTHLARFKMHLFLGFGSGRLINSSLGAPLVYDAVTGANDIGTGKGVTGLRAFSNALLIMCGDETHYLVGDSQSGFEIKPHKSLTGAVEWSLGDSPAGLLYLDTHGLTALEATDRSGDFESNTIDQPVRDLVNVLRSKLTCVGPVRSKNQYRMFGNDGTALVLAEANGKLVGFTELEYPHNVTRWCSERDANEQERIFFGTDDGYVMEAEVGTSFDGQAIEAILRPHYWNAGAPERNKKFIRTIVVIKAAANMDLFVTPDYEGGDTGLVLSGDRQQIDPAPPGGRYGSAQYGTSVYGGAESGRQIIETPAESLSIGFSFYSSSAQAEPHTLVGLIPHISPRRIAR